MAQRKLYLDSDGVLADFDASIFNIFRTTFAEMEQSRGSEQSWLVVSLINGFFRHLPLMPGARKLYEAVRHLQPEILTGCPKGGWSEQEKVQWAAEHFPGVPCRTCSAKDKYKFIRNRGDVLVDDRLKHRQLWEDAGGIFVPYDATNPDKAIAEVLALFTS